MKYETRVKREDKDKVWFRLLIITNQDLLFNTLKLCVGVCVFACEYIHLSAGTHSGPEVSGLLQVGLRWL